MLIGDTANAPADCGAEVVASKLNDLLGAISNGDRQIMETFFGGKDGPPIFWFSMTDMRPNPRKHFAAQSKDSLEVYFDQQARGPELLRVTRLKSLGWNKSQVNGMLANSLTPGTPRLRQRRCPATFDYA